MIKYIKRIRELTLKDFFAIFIFPFAYIISLFYRKKNKNLILICEAREEARDNGYWLFKYITEKYPNQNVAYVIDFSSTDYLKVKELGKCIEYGSFKHWVYYLSSNLNVSTQKEGKPNAAIFYVLEVFGILKNKRIFLQHGITISDAKWLYYKNTKFRTFICGARPEYEAVKANFGYPKGYVQYLGFSRFDELDSKILKKHQILLMPSWRNWLFRKTEAYYNFKEGDDFKKTEYYQNWNSFLTNKELIFFIENNNLELIFYPHRNIQEHIYDFEKKSNNIIFASWTEYDIQALLKESAFLITDYSSIFMDFSYMNKPSVYFQFDLEKFRKGQYQLGYFDYEKDGFGPVYRKIEDVINYLKLSYSNEFKIEEEYQERINKYFPVRDVNNSKRIYEYLKKMLNE